MTVAAWVDFPAGAEPATARAATHERLVRQRDRRKARLADRRFRHGAPPAVVDAERMRLTELELALSCLDRPLPS